MNVRSEKKVERGSKERIKEKEKGMEREGEGK